MLWSRANVSLLPPLHETPAHLYLQQQLSPTHSRPAHEDEDPGLIAPAPPLSNTHTHVHQSISNRFSLGRGRNLRVNLDPQTSPKNSAVRSCTWWTYMYELTRNFFQVIKTRQPHWLINASERLVLRLPWLHCNTTLFKSQVTRTNACVSDYACIRDKHGYHLGTPVVISWTYAPELTCGDLMSSLPME